MEKRRVPIEYTHFEPGERVRLIHEHGITGTVLETRPPTSVSRAGVLIKLDHSGTTTCFCCEVMEPIPEPPITNEEIGLAMKHNDFESFSRNGSWWQFQLVNPYTEIKKPTKREALEALVRELRKRSADANKKEQS
jgi:hypothetical protein